MERSDRTEPSVRTQTGSRSRKIPPKRIPHIQHINNESATHEENNREKRGESMTNYDMDELRRQGKIPEELKEGEYRKHQEKFDKKSDEQKRIFQDYKKLKEDKKNDRFDLEEAIHSIWQTEDDLDTVLYAIMDAHTDEPPSNDEIVNMILGIKELHGARMQRLWDIFEDFVHNQHDTIWKDIKDHQSSDYADRYEEKEEWAGHEDYIKKQLEHEEGYEFKRRRNYPPLFEQLDALYWDMKNGTDNWVKSREAVKEKYPKPENKNV